MKKLLCWLLGHRRRWTFQSTLFGIDAGSTTCRCVRCGAYLTEKEEA